MNDLTKNDPREEVYSNLEKWFNTNPQEFTRVFNQIFEEYTKIPMLLEFIATLSGNKKSFGNYALFYAKEMIERIKEEAK